jgi:tetratricopeptide (TPR) repeat protein
MTSIRRTLQEAHRRNLWRVLGIFVGGGWAVLQVIDLFIDRGFVPEWLFAGALVAMVIGLPLVLTTAWVQGGKMGVRVPRPDEIGVGAAGGAADIFTWNRAIVGGVIAFAILGVGAATYMVMRVTGVGMPGTLTAQGVFDVGSRIVLADFESSAGDAAPSDLITEALRIDLAQSSALVLVGPQEIAEALERMRVDAGAPMTEEVAREVAVRVGAPVVIAGEIGGIGSGFVLTARVLEAESGTVLAPFRVTADDEDQLISAIDDLSGRVRSKIGESLRSVAETVALPRVTTSSLEALRRFTTAINGVPRGRLSPSAAQALLEEAVSIDTTFAMGYRALSVSIRNYGGDREVGVRASEAAFRHRGRLPDRERLVIEASYYTFTLGEERSAIEAFQGLLALDSTDATTAINLSDALIYAGEYEEAVRVLRRTPNWAAQPYAWNLMTALAALGRHEEALAVRDTADVTQPDEPFAKASRSILLATAGRLEEAREVLDRGPETSFAAAAAWEVYARGVIDVLSGRLDAAEQSFRTAERLVVQQQTPSDGLNTGMSLALTLSWIEGDSARAATELESLLDRLDIESLSPFNREYPFIALVYALNGDHEVALGMLTRYRSEAATLRDPLSESRAVIAQALIDVSRSGSSALGRLESAVEAYRCARCRDFFLGHGYEVAGQPDRAIEAYERFLEHPFFDGPDFITHGLNTTMHERLGLLYDQVGNAPQAAEHYRAFAELWSDSDADLQPRVRRAAERAAALGAR